jgi:alcohol dehydrogenase class IV
MARLAGALGAEDPVSGLLRLEERLGVPSSLAELGMPADGVDRVVGTLMEDGVENPRPLEAGPLRDLLGRALRGDGPPAEGWAA